MTKENDMEWISLEDRLPEIESEEYAVTDGRSLFMAYYGFSHTIRKTIFQSTSDDFDSLYGCDTITHWMPLAKLPKEIGE